VHLNKIWADRLELTRNVARWFPNGRAHGGWRTRVLSRGAKPRSEEENLVQTSNFRLLYVSTASASAAMALHETMSAILKVSDANNRRDDITGFLLSDGYLFVQALEGPERHVKECFSRICADDRNCTPEVRDAGPAPERLFPQWAMCGLNLSGRDNALLRPGHIGFDLFAAAPGALLQHLQTLAQRHGPALMQAHAPLLDPPR